MKLNSFTPMGKQLLTSLSGVTSSLFPGNNHYSGPDVELVIITCEETDSSDPSIPVFWHKISHAWREIQCPRPGAEMSAWRFIVQYAREITPGLRVFRLRQNEKPLYFYLLAEGDFYEGLSRLNNLLCILSAWQHIKRGHGFFHAAGVVRWDSAYLFVGPSGSGKSTVSNLSAGHGCTVIHEDHVVVYAGEEGKYVVSDRSLTVRGIPLQGFFFLNQDTTNHLIPLSPPETAKGLLESSFDIARLLLHGQLLRDTFAFSAEIARCIPGYNLHFRKSLDFWDVIVEEFKK